MGKKKSWFKVGKKRFQNFKVMSFCSLFNSHDKNVDLSTWQCSQMTLLLLGEKNQFVFDVVEYMVGKGENAG